MLKYLLVLLLAVSTFSEIRKLPQNIRIEFDTVYVKADTTVYTKKFQFAQDAWKIGKIAIFDTNLVDQDTIDIGSGVEIKQRVCFPWGNTFGYAVSETLCTICGDSVLSPFVNSEGISSDSLIMSSVDTSQMTHTSIGGDSLWVANGYFVPVTDPAALIDYSITGNSDFGATMKKVYIMFEIIDNIPASSGDR